MPNIPIGQFGYRTPRLADTTPVAGPDGSVGDAAARVGNVVQAFGARQLHDAQQQQRYDDAEQARLQKEAEAQNRQVQTLTAHASIQNGLADAYDAISADVSSGKSDKIAATAAWNETASKVVSDNLAGVPADRRELVAAQVKGLQGRLTNQLFDTFRKRDQEQVAGSMVTQRGALERFASTDPGGAIKQWDMYADQIGPAAGWNPEQIAKAKQSFREGVTYNTFRAAAQAAYQTGDPAAIDAVQKRIAGPEGDTLDPAKRNALDQTTFGWKQNIEAKQAAQAARAEREQERRFNKAGDAIKQGFDLALNGQFMAPEFIDQTSQLVAGTGREQEWQQVLESQRQVAGFASQPPDKRAAILNAARARVADPGAGTTPDRAKLLNRAESIDANLRKQVDENPWQAAQSVGVIRQAPTLNLADAAGAQKVITQRMQDIGTIEAWAGKKVSPLQPAEADQLQRMVKTLKPDQAATLLGTIGGLVSDSDRVAAVAKQIGDKDNVMGMAMLYANTKTSQGRNTAELVLQGAQAIKDKTIKVDGMAESGWRAAIAKEVRGAYSNQEVETNMIEAAFLITAAKGGDVDNALRLATGGIVERNGGKIPLPYGLKERDFDKRIEAITPQTLLPQVLAAPTPQGIERAASDGAPDAAVYAGPTRIPLAEFVKLLPNARLVHAGPGMYSVQAGQQLVTNDRGQRIVLRIQP